MLEVDVFDRPEALDMVRRIRLAQDDLHQLFEEVRGYAAPLRLDRDICELPTIWRQAWNELVNFHQEKHLRFSEAIETAEAQANVDEFTLRQVFRNIFENAIQASPPGSEITVRCAREPDGQMTIVVADQGPGIPEADRTSFRAVFYDKSQRDGLGTRNCPSHCRKPRRLHRSWRSDDWH